jgi:hypothetical protein
LFYHDDTTPSAKLILKGSLIFCRRFYAMEKPQFNRRPWFQQTFSTACGGNATKIAIFKSALDHLSSIAQPRFASGLSCSPMRRRRDGVVGMPGRWPNMCRFTGRGGHADHNAPAGGLCSAHFSGIF